jgi:hypothetical protein
MSRLLSIAITLVLFTSAPLAAFQVNINLQKSVEDRVVVAENKTVFSLFCLLNLAGYDDEHNRDDGMHPVRIRVREQLVHAVRPELAKRIRDFYRQHAAATPYDYAVVAMSTSGPPEFKFTADWPDVSKEASFAALSDSPVLLRELYATASVEQIYAKVRPDYTEYIDDYRAAVLAQVAKVMAYCRVSALSSGGGGEVPHAVVIPNLLQSFNNAFSFVLGDTFYSVEGPQQKIGYNPHEFVHSITNSLSYDPQYKSLQDPAEPLFALAKTQPDTSDLKSLQSFLDENLVRAISLRYLDSGDPARTNHLQEALMKEYRSGYTLEAFFYEQLGEYEKTNQSLREFYPIMLRHLKVKDEMARWEHEKELAK